MVGEARDKIKASKIDCPIRSCAYQCVDKTASKDERVEPTQELVNELYSHLLISHSIKLSDDVKETIQAKIYYFRTNKKIHYTDPFLYVSEEEIR